MVKCQQLQSVHLLEDLIALGTNTRLGRSQALSHPGANGKQEGWADKACRSLTRFAVVQSQKQRSLHGRNLYSTSSMG